MGGLLFGVLFPRATGGAEIRKQAWMCSSVIFRVAAVCCWVLNFPNPTDFWALAPKLYLDRSSWLLSLACDRFVHLNDNCHCHGPATTLLMTEFAGIISKFMHLPFRSKIGVIWLFSLFVIVLRSLKDMRLPFLLM